MGLSKSRGKNLQFLDESGGKKVEFFINNMGDLKIIKVVAVLELAVV